MDLVGLIIANILPLYALIVLGFIAGRYLDVNLHSISKLLIFILSPYVAFGAVLNVEFDPAYILLPVIMWVVSIFITFVALKICNKIWDGRQWVSGCGWQREWQCNLFRPVPYSGAVWTGRGRDLSVYEFRADD